MALNDGCVYTSQVSAADAGRTLLKHLAESYRHSTTEVWHARLQRGEVVLDERVATGDERVRAGQRVIWTRPPWNEPEVPLGFTLLYEDAAMLVVNKPAGLPTLPAGGFLAHTLLTVIRRHYPDASPVHRLGRFTSGLVLCARSAEAGAALSRAWRDHRVSKRYRALGRGRPDWIRRHITARIGPVAHPVLGTVHAASDRGRPAHSIAHALAARGDDTLFDVEITTGRPHQIRIHLAWARHPLVGDPLYTIGGVPYSATSALPGDGGYRLHAHHLSLEHPITRQSLAFEAPPPAELI